MALQLEHPCQIARIVRDHQPLYRLARPMALGPIEDAAFAPYLRERFAAGHSQITQDGIEALLAITGGHPNDTQELAHFAWVRAIAEGRPATRDMLQRALADVVSAESARFILVWDNLSPLQRRVLGAVAHDGTRLYAGEVRQRFQLGDPSGLQKAIQRLSDLELIEHRDDEFCGFRRDSQSGLAAHPACRTLEP